eukprot:m.292768 g.292768  ORF g.292768 m.292768 type:complete len:504 (-) comp12668_c0_seq1:74-1585(-)
MVADAQQHAVACRHHGTCKTVNGQWCVVGNAQNPAEVAERLGRGQATRGENFGRAAVVELGEVARGQNPRAAAAVVVALVAAVENAGHTVVVINAVDGVSLAEELVVHLNGRGNAGPRWAVMAVVGVAVVKGGNDSGILLAVLCLHDKGACPERVERGCHVVGGLLVARGRAAVAHLLRKLGACHHGAAVVHAVPEKVGRLDLLPEITRVGVPVVRDVVQIVLDGAAVLRAVSRPQVLRHVRLAALREQLVGIQHQRRRAQTGTVVLGTAPAASEHVAVGQVELGLGAHVDAVGVRIGLGAQHPLHVCLHLAVDIRNRVVVTQHSAHRQRAIAHPVVVVAAAARHRAVRACNNAALATNVDIGSKVLEDDAHLSAVEGCSTRGRRWRGRRAGSRRGRGAGAALLEVAPRCLRVRLLRRPAAALGLALLLVDALITAVTLVLVVQGARVVASHAASGQQHHSKGQPQLRHVGLLQEKMPPSLPLLLLLCPTCSMPDILFALDRA